VGTLLRVAGAPASATERDAVLEGSGEPLRELRALLTQLRYEDRQRRLVGELELLVAALEASLRFEALTPEEVAALARDRIGRILEQVARPPWWRLRP
jgi:hypothetical protein